MKNSYIKSPLNYTGGKYKLLPQIIPLFPKEIDTFVDLFTGGCNVAVNVQANKKICNDLEPHLIDFYNNIKLRSGEEVKQIILANVKKYDLSKTNKEGFLECRNDYNNCKTWDMLYTLISHSFNNQIRYNKTAGFNSSFGKDKSCFNTNLQSNIVNFTDELNCNYTFINEDFRNIDFTNLKENDFIYIDPPYLVSVASYNETNRYLKGWTEKEELDLLKLLDTLSALGLKWAMSNVLVHKGKTNDRLISWCNARSDLNIHHLNHTYCHYNYTDEALKNNFSDEVLICNY